MKKLLAYFVAFAVSLFCAATLLSPAVAGAEELPAIKVLYAGDYSVEAVAADEEIVMKITFSFNGDDLSFYWSGEFQTWRPIWISISGTETLNGGYVIEE
jgi:hypothetical protein